MKVPNVLDFCSQKKSKRTNEAFTAHDTKGATFSVCAESASDWINSRAFSWSNDALRVLEKTKHVASAVIQCLSVTKKEPALIEMCALPLIGV